MGAASSGDGRDIGAIPAIRAAKGGGGLLAAWLVLLLSVSGPCLTAFQSAVVAPLGSSIAEHFGGGERGATLAQLGMTVPALGVMIGGPLTAWLLPRFGYRTVIVVSGAVLAISGAIFAYVDSAVLFLASRLLVGFSAVALYSAMVALTGALFSGVTMGRMVSYQNGLSAVMGMVLVLVSGWVASHFGWRTSFLIYLPAGLIAVLAAVAWLPPKAPRTQKTKRERVSLRPLLPVYLISIADYAIVFMVMVQGSLLMSANGINDPEIQSPVIAASTVAYAVMATACSWVETHVTKRWTLAAALALQAAGMLAMGGLPMVGGAMAGSLLIGAGSGLASTYLVKLVLEGAPEGGREQAVGWIAPTHYLGQFLNPFLMQSLRVAIGIQTAFLIVGAMVAVGALAALLLTRRPSPAAAEASSS